MGAAALRDAMTAAGLRVGDVTLHYEAAGGQVITAHGWTADGAPFTVASEPFAGDPVARAAALGRDLIAARKLTAEIAHGADRIAAATVIAKALVDGNKRMSLAEKCGTLAARAKAVPRALEARADALMPRLDAVEQKGNAAFDGIEAVVKDAEDAAAATEAAVRAISNAPLGEGSGTL